MLKIVSQLSYCQYFFDLTSPSLIQSCEVNKWVNKQSNKQVNLISINIVFLKLQLGFSEMYTLILIFINSRNKTKAKMKLFMSTGCKIQTLINSIQHVRKTRITCIVANNKCTANVHIVFSSIMLVKFHFFSMKKNTSPHVSYCVKVRFS